MKISVIIPVYNVYKYVNECVSSVLKLKQDFEMILVDDGSTDGSGELCDQLALGNSRIRVIHQENAGLSSARNTGIRNATGDYLMFLDSDDFIDPHETDQMFTQFNGSAEVLMGFYNNYYEQDNSYKAEECNALFKFGNTLCDISDFLPSVPRSGASCYMVAWRFIVSRNFILENELFFTKGIYHEDEEWTQRLLTQTEKIFVANRFFYQYRQARSGSIMATVKPKHVLDSFFIMERANKLSEIFPIRYPQIEYLRYRIAQLYISNILNLHVLNDEQMDEAIKTLKRYKKICNRYFSGATGVAIHGFQSIFGIRCTSRCIQFLKRLKKNANE